MSFKKYAVPPYDEVGRGAFVEEAQKVPGHIPFLELQIALIEQYEASLHMFKLMPRHGRILDAGCGFGRWTAYLRKQGHEVEGVDLSHEALKLLKDHDAGIRASVGDVHALPYKPNSYDAVFSSYVLEHFENGPQEALRETHRVLKPDGLLFIVVPFNNLFRKLVTNNLLRLQFLLDLVRGHELGFDEYRFSRKELHVILEDCGFETLTTHPDDFRYPKVKGLYIDYLDAFGPMTIPSDSSGGKGPESGWEFGTLGKGLARLLNLISPWTCCSGVFCIAQARK